MRQTIHILSSAHLRGDPIADLDLAKPFAVMLLEDGRRMEVNAATFVRLAINCLQEIAKVAAPDGIEPSHPNPKSGALPLS